jgi:hypothetical protein
VGYDDLMDLALVTYLYKPFDILVEERLPELFQKLHLHGINLHIERTSIQHLPTQREHSEDPWLGQTTDDIVKLQYQAS